MILAILTGPTTWTDFWAIIASAAGVLALGVPFAVKKVWPWWRRRQQRREAEHVALVGSPPVIDPATGAERAPAIPGMADRMASTELKVDRLTEIVARLADTDVRLDSLERAHLTLEERTSALERATMERIATRAENAAAMSMIEKLHTGED